MSFNVQQGTILTNFCNPKIPGLGRRQSQDLGLAKMARIWDTRIAVSTWNGCRYLSHYLFHCRLM